MAGWLLLGGSLLAIAVASFQALAPFWHAGAVRHPELTSGRQRLWIAAVGLFTAGFEVSFLGLAALTGELTSRRLSRSDPKPPPTPQWPRKGR